MSDRPRNNLTGSLWLLADMSLNIWALSIVKAMGLDYPATQLVFLRAVVGLVVISPWIWRSKAMFRDIPDLRFHLLRVALSAITLLGSFFVLARIPFALFTAVNFTRPILTMMMAAVFMSEFIGIGRWIAAAIAFAGILIAINPWSVNVSWNVLILLGVVATGSAAVIVTRRLRAAPSIVLMGFYTGGLSLILAPFAIATWQPVQATDALPLLAIGIFAQSAQFCFLRAHFWGEAGVLSVLGYTSLILSASVGYIVFDERVDLPFVAGSILVILAALSVQSRPDRNLRLP